MKHFGSIDKYLLPAKYKKTGWILLAISPLIWIVIYPTIFMIGMDYSSQDFSGFWDQYGLILVHLPISISLYIILMAREKEEDEMYARIRMEAIIHGLRFIVSGVFAVALLGLLLWFVFGIEYGIGAIGGEMAVISLFLVYANGSYFLLKREYVEESA